MATKVITFEPGPFNKNAAGKVMEIETTERYRAPGLNMQRDDFEADADGTILGADVQVGDYLSTGPFTHERVASIDDTA